MFKSVKSRKPWFLNLGFGISVLGFGISMLIGGYTLALSEPLHKIAKEGDLVTAERLIQKGSDVNARGESGWTPLHFAVDEGHKDLVKLLISKGADVNARTAHGWTPMHKAAFRGYRDVAELLISYGADLYVRSDNGMAPIHAAAFVGDVETVELLVSKGADVNDIKFNDWDSENGGYSFEEIDMLEMLIFRCHDINWERTDGRDPMNEVSSRDYSWSGFIYEKNGGVNGWTPLHYAAYVGHRDVVELLISKGADVSAIDLRCRTPLDYAIFKENRWCLRKT